MGLLDKFGLNFVKQYIKSDVHKFISTLDAYIDGADKLLKADNGMKLIAHGNTWFTTLECLQSLSTVEVSVYKQDLQKLQTDIEHLISITDVRNIPDFTSYSKYMELYTVGTNRYLYIRYLIPDDKNEYKFILDMIVPAPKVVDNERILNALYKQIRHVQNSSI